MTTIQPGEINSALFALGQELNKMPYGGTAGIARPKILDRRVTADVDATIDLCTIINDVTIGLARLRALLVHVAYDDTHRRQQLDRIRAHAAAALKLDTLAGYIVDHADTGDDSLSGRVTELQGRLVDLRERTHGEMWHVANDALEVLADITMIVDGGGTAVPATTVEERETI